MHVTVRGSMILCIYCFHFGSQIQISGVCHYKEQMPLISDPNLFLAHTALVSVLALSLSYATPMHLKWEVKELRVQTVLHV